MRLRHSIKNFATPPLALQKSTPLHQPQMLRSLGLRDSTDPGQRSHWNRFTGQKQLDHLEPLRMCEDAKTLGSFAQCCSIEKSGFSGAGHRDSPGTDFRLIYRIIPICQ